MRGIAALARPAESAYASRPRRRRAVEPVGHHHARLLQEDATVAEYHPGPKSSIIER